MSNLPDISILLKSTDIAPCLTIEHKDLSPAAYSFIIAETPCLITNVTAVHPRPDTIFPSGSFCCCIVQIPDLQPAVIVPSYPLPVYRIVPVPGSWYFLTCF